MAPVRTATTVVTRVGVRSIKVLISFRFSSHRASLTSGHASTILGHFKPAPLLLVEN
jgi:hypothetical protein